MLTAKGKYGLKAMIYLASLKPGATAHGSEIAKANNISKKFLDAILSELRKAGLVKSKRGPGGGYMVARSPQAIKVGLVIRTLDGPLAPIACASRSAYRPCRDCKSVARCEVRRTMAQVRDATASILDGLSIAEMIRSSEVASQRSSRPPAIRRRPPIAA